MAGLWFGNRVFVLVNILYFTNFIPPIPLSIKDAGVYHSIKRNVDGNYDVTVEPQDWRKYITLYPDYHKTPGEPVYVYSAVFSPAQFNMTITHQWQYLDSSGKWVTASEIPLKVVGGRDGGFRTYSEKFNPAPGKWRVNVLTDRGQVIGRVRFNIVAVDSQPNVVQQVN